MMKCRVDHHLIVLNLYIVSIKQNSIQKNCYCEVLKIVIAKFRRIQVRCRKTNTMKSTTKWLRLSKVIECLEKSNTRMNARHSKIKRL